MIGASRPLGRGHLPFPFLIVLCLMLAPSAWAADVVELHFESAAADPALEDLLYLAIGVELSQAGLSSSRVAGTGTYFLAADYSTAETGVHLVLQLSKKGSSEPLASEEDDLPLDDRFETQVGQTLRRLLAEGLGQDRSNAGAETTIGGILPEAPTGKLPTKVSWREDAVVGATSIFGDLADISQGGFGAALNSGMFWLADTWSLKVGLRIGTIQLADNPGVTGGPLYLSSVAIGADWGTGRQLPFRLMVGGTVGALLLTVAQTPVRTKTVAWVDADAAMEFPVGAGFSLGAELRLQAAFENFIIWGVSPGLIVGKEF